ncbi:MAG: hypothetical protein ACRDDH_03990 [Cetobacterium sp.]|uniref:hypothetical protein n=1 Tax=Cetobacterium sp. TaxID=2071632 RepID=UPI003EE6B309
MEKYLDILRVAKEKEEKVKIMKFYEECQKDGFSLPKIMREVIKNGLQDILIK